MSSSGIRAPAATVSRAEASELETLAAEFGRSFAAARHSKWKLPARLGLEVPRSALEWVHRCLWAGPRVSYGRLTLARRTSSVPTHRSFLRNERRQCRPRQPPSRRLRRQPESFLRQLRPRPPPRPRAI